MWTRYNSCPTSRGRDKKVARKNGRRDLFWKATDLALVDGVVVFVHPSSFRTRPLRVNLQRRDINLVRYFFAGCRNADSPIGARHPLAQEGSVYIEKALDKPGEMNTKSTKHRAESGEVK